MNVLIIGSGGREHALTWAVSKSEKSEQLYVAPGNAGTKEIAENVDIDISDFPKVVKFCKEKQIGLVVIGPEVPLVNGLADYLRENGIKTFGPSAKAAQIEGDKAFAKELMTKYGIPTAKYSVFVKEEKERLLDFLKNREYPCVIKASGLAAGKGVTVVENYNEAQKTVDELFSVGKFEKAGEKVIVEDFLEGEEESVFAITDGEDFLLLPSANDHKRIFDNDKGPNTGGMGAFAPGLNVKDEVVEKVKKKIIMPVLKALKKETGGFAGCLYAGLMIKNGGPKVVEFNCRFGDPETQVVLPLLRGDFLELLSSVANGKLNKESVEIEDKTALCVVAASEGYPGAYKKGLEIKGIEKAKEKGALIFHAGTKEENGKILTNGGRVLNVVSVVEGKDLMTAKQKCYEAISEISFEGIYYRKDIGEKGNYFEINSK